MATAPTFGVVNMTPKEHRAKKIDFNHDGQIVPKTQRQATIDKNFQIQAGMSNSGKVTLNPNNKHGVTLSIVPGSVATN